MKSILGALALAMTSGCHAPSAPVNLDGAFTPDQERSIAWMIQAKHPAVVGDGRLEKYKKAACSGTPLIHHWMNGKLEVEISSDWREPYDREWIKTGPDHFKSIKPRDKNNTELVTTITIEDADNYFLEIAVNGRTTREYFTRMATKAKAREQTAP